MKSKIRCLWIVSAFLLLAILSTPSSSSAQGPIRYRVVKVPELPVNFEGDRAKEGRRLLQELLDKQGREGWRLVVMEWSYDGFLIFMKEGS